MAIKSYEEIKARKELIAGPDEDSPAFKLEQSFGDLDRMSVEDLVDRLEQVTNQSTLIIARIWWAIRQKFKSDKLFGQYIIQMRDSTPSLCASSQHINRYINLGRFCEAYRITDITRLGISQTGLYELSRPINDDVARKVFKEVKHKGYKVEEIQRRIAQARAVSTIDQKPEPITYEQPKEAAIAPREPYTIEVVKGVAQVGELIEHEEPEEELSPEMAEALDRHESVSILRENLIENDEDRRSETNVEMAADSRTLSDEGIVDAILSFLAWYKLSPMKLIAILQLVIKRIQSETYRSQS